jgi:hypothetical protein
VPYNWVPLLPVQLDPNNPSIVLRRGRALSDLGPLQATASPAVGSILNPSQVTGHYDVDEEELPRSGLRIERVVCRSRWSDGSSHLWVQRRRRVGAGESQAALQFDRALPNETPTT